MRPSLCFFRREATNTAGGNQWLLGRARRARPVIEAHAQGGACARTRTGLDFESVFVAKELERPKILLRHVVLIAVVMFPSLPRDHSTACLVPESLFNSVPSESQSPGFEQVIGAFFRGKSSNSWEVGC